MALDCVGCSYWARLPRWFSEKKPQSKEMLLWMKSWKLTQMMMMVKRKQRTSRPAVRWRWIYAQRHNWCRWKSRLEARGYTCHVTAHKLHEWHNSHTYSSMQLLYIWKHYEPRPSASLPACIYLAIVCQVFCLSERSMRALNTWTSCELLFPLSL